MKLSDEMLNKMFEESLPKDSEAILECLKSAVKRHGDTAWVEYYIKGTPYKLHLTLVLRTDGENMEE